MNKHTEFHGNPAFIVQSHEAKCWLEGNVDLMSVLDKEWVAEIRVDPLGTMKIHSKCHYNLAPFC